MTASFICFLLWTFTLIARPQDYLPFLIPLRPVLILTILTVLLMILEKVPIPRGIFRLREVRLLGAFYAIVLLGVPFAVHRGVALNFALFYFLSTTVFFMAALIQVRSSERLLLLAWVVTVALFFSSGAYLETAVRSMSQGFRADASQVYDPNDIAMVFVTFLPICLYVFFSPVGIIRKIVSTLTVLCAAVGVVGSGSRGGMLALFVVMACMAVLKIPRWKRTLKVLTVVMLVGFVVNFFSTMETRFQGLEDDYNITSEGGRLHIWGQNLEILAERPILGVGGSCSAIALGLRRISEGGLQAWQVTHSSPLQVAVETGIPGFIIYAILNVGAVLIVRRVRKSKGHPHALAAFFVEISFYAFWVGGLFLSHAYSSNLFLLLAMAGTIRRFDNDWRASKGTLKNADLASHKADGKDEMGVAHKHREVGDFRNNKGKSEART